MFYKKEDVDSHLICPLCSEFFRDPWLLPCGMSACHECIRAIKCPDCKQQHTPADKSHGFLTNKILLKLIESKSSDVYRGKQVENLKTKLAEIKNSRDNFKADLKNATENIQENCFQLRNQVHLETDLLIQKIYDFNKKLIQEINEYEKECMESFNSK